MIRFLGGGEAGALTHDQLEARLEQDGRELVRQLLQDHLDLRAGRERRAEGVIDSGGVARNAVETGHGRGLMTIFGAVRVTRLAYRARGSANLYVADAELGLPLELCSFGLRERCAVEAARGSYQEATAAISRMTGAALGKRQVEALAAQACADFDAFYARAQHAPAPDGDDVLVLSADGKGIVMRPDGLRPATAAKAASSSNKLNGRLSKGEKANRKRMAEVGAVYAVAPVVRSATDVMAHRGAGPPKQAPQATNKWVCASVAQDAANVIGRVFDEAERRDPDHARVWVALVDGNNHQINRINTEAAARGIQVTIIVDWVHVLEYLWSAAWSFFPEADPAAEQWVHDKALDVLAGRAPIVAAAIRRKATMLGLDDTTRNNADRCADYLLAKARYLDYPKALSSGWPIATGVIEGAVRHVVKDRMDITGARWGLDGAEAILKLRAIRANNDWDDYWQFHLTEERKRVHHTRYLNGVIPAAA